MEYAVAQGHMVPSREDSGIDQGQEFL
jgi:hypothetical protein